MSWVDGTTCADTGAGFFDDGRHLQRRVKSKGRFNKKARCRLCDRQTDDDAKQQGIGTRPTNVFQRSGLTENIFTRDENSRRLQVDVQQGRAQCENASLVDFILEEESTTEAFVNITEAEIVFEEEVDCSATSPACTGSDGGEDFPCCGADGCRCRHHSESLCLDEQCNLPGGLCCAFDATGFAYAGCSRNCLGLAGQCEDQPFATSRPASQQGNDGEFYLSNVMEIEQMCGDTDDGELSRSQRALLEELLLSYANNILSFAECGASSFTSVTITSFEQGSSCAGGSVGRQGATLLHFNAAGVCDEGVCPDKYPLEISSALQRFLLQGVGLQPSIGGYGYNRRRQLVADDDYFIHFLNESSRPTWSNITHALITASTSVNCTGCLNNTNPGGDPTGACCGAENCPCVHLSDSLCESNACRIDGSGACCDETMNWGNCSNTSYCLFTPFVSSSTETLYMSSVPSAKPSGLPSEMPSIAPSASPSHVPSSSPSARPSNGPSLEPTSLPSHHPSFVPSIDPSADPSQLPTMSPSEWPRGGPSAIPSGSPSDEPTYLPSTMPSSEGDTPNPSDIPTFEPSDRPTLSPSEAPIDTPTSVPSEDPSQRPTPGPSGTPSSSPSESPTEAPSAAPSTVSLVISRKGCHIVCGTVQSINDALPQTWYLLLIN